MALDLTFAHRRVGEKAQGFIRTRYMGSDMRSALKAEIASAAAVFLALINPCIAREDHLAAAQVASGWV